LDGWGTQNSAPELLTRVAADAEKYCAAATARGGLDELVTRLFQDRFPEWERQRKPDLANMIDQLRKGGAIPATIESGMHTVRVFGNVGAHRTMQLTRGDVEVCLLQALRIVEWFLRERIV
jgi:hypothetical protein